MKKAIRTSLAPFPIGPYNQAIDTGNTLYVSGQIAINPVDGTLVMDSIEAETKQVLENLKAILEAAKYQLSDVVKCSVFVKNMDDFSRINAVYSTYFEEENAPARELVQVADLPRHVNIEISAIASKTL